MQNAQESKFFCIQTIWFITQTNYKRFKNHPALYGYYVTDEPSADDFKLVRDWINIIKEFDPIHPVYVNLYPNYALPSQMKKDSYENYLNEFTNAVPIDFISFDNYPLMSNKIHSKWYENLEQIRKILNS